MCKDGCRHWEVSSEVINGKVIQTCKDCGKQIEMPGTISEVIKYMKGNPEHKTRLEYINKYYSRVI